MNDLFLICLIILLMLLFITYHHYRIIHFGKKLDKIYKTLHIVDKEEEDGIL